MRMATPAPSLVAIHGRLDALLAERDRHFPRRDPENTRKLRDALAAYTVALHQARDLAWRPDPRQLAAARATLGSPIVVCGFMRSGTTLLADLLDGHPELVVLPGDSHMTDAGDDARREHEPQAYWIPMLVTPRGQAPFWFFGDADDAYVEFLGYLDHALATGQGGPRGRFLAYVTALQCANPVGPHGPRAWVEKTPENESRVDEVRRWFPAARFIHIVRDPLETLASVKRLFIERGWGWKPWSVVTTARKLAASIATADRHRSQLGAERYHVLCYEDLVERPREKMGEVARFLGLAWNEILLTPTMNRTPTTPNSMYHDRRAGRGRVVDTRDPRWPQVLTAPERVVARVVLRLASRSWGYA
jgi:Sulfotransferase family